VNVSRVRVARQLVRMPLQRERVARGGARNRELEELRRRIEELETRRYGDVETGSESEDEPEEE
jgi:hypothetical protein